MDNCKVNKLVENNIQKTRHVAIALVGAGMEGINGLHISVNLQVWNCYILPRLAYSLVVLPLTETNISNLDVY